MKIKIEITCDNAAFEPSPERELTEILHRVIHLLNTLDDFTGPLHDSNGNRVGFVSIEEGGDHGLD